MDVEELLNRIHGHLIDHAPTMGLLAQLAALEDAESCAAILGELAVDDTLDEGVRAYAASLYFDAASPEHTQALRRHVHDRREVRAVRLHALEALSLTQDALLHVDLSALLTDPAERDWMRAAAADLIGQRGMARQMAPLLTQTLSSDTLPAEVAFWCLHSCAELTDEIALEPLVARYLDDHRPVTLKWGTPYQVPLSTEAQWVLDQLRGEHSEAEWLAFRA